MLDFLKGWEGVIEIDGTPYENYSAIPSDFKISSDTIILLHTEKKSSAGQIAAAK